MTEYTHIALRLVLDDVVPASKYFMYKYVYSKIISYFCISSAYEQVVEYFL